MLEVTNMDEFSLSLSSKDFSFYFSYVWLLKSFVQFDQVQQCFSIYVIKKYPISWSRLQVKICNIC